MRNPSLDNASRVPASRRRYRASLAWLAVVALLSNALLPVAVAVGVGHNAVAAGLCSAISGHDLPGKAKPALLVHDCAFCAAAPTALSPPQSAFILPYKIAAEAPPLLRDAAPPASSRNCRAQPRAPPASA